MHPLYFMHAAALARAAKLTNATHSPDMPFGRLTCIIRVLMTLTRTSTFTEYVCPKPFELYTSLFDVYSD